ncbi:hexosaminidase D-like [Protopterus annectens]|uniref:hexosaminidase D-like n=1 Tax=Protopterus annectens TaxID=7888 RepID=UPI001CFB5289|nr:hexosaminidase D-like [Protopterus annectens]
MNIIRGQPLNLLRLFVFILVAVAAVKLLSSSAKQRYSNDLNSFWEEKKSLESHYQVMRGPEEHAAKLELPQGNGMNQGRHSEDDQTSKDFIKTEMRLVHLDLKGAAPKVTYLEKIFPLLSSLGANGILIEYEDMFPFHGALEILKSSYAYSTEDIDKILHLAEVNSLEVVPLVQTFGHMEYVLKHDKYRHLREMEKYPNSLNPHLPESVSLVKDIVTQVLDRHSKSTWVHIGADEVFHLGDGRESKNWLNQNNGDLGKMFLNHVKEIGNFIIKKYSGIRLILWDDMLRSIKLDTIKESGITEYMSPVIWSYIKDLKTEVIGAELEIERMVASLTPERIHTLRHQVKSLIRKKEHLPNLYFRYDHYSVLCELLPVGIPSLAVCLQTLVHGGFTEIAKKKILETLGFNDINIQENVCVGSGTFPGYDVYQMVYRIHTSLKEDVKRIEDDEAIKGWFTVYHRKHSFGNPYFMERFGNTVQRTCTDWEKFLETFRTTMETIYFSDTVSEWLDVYVNPYMETLITIVKNYDDIIKLNARPKST